MKANGIKATDYSCTGNTLVLALCDTTMDKILNIDTDILRITTDDGDIVEAFGGFQLQQVTYSKEEDSFTALLAREVSNSVAKAVDKLAEELAAAKIILGVE